MAEEDDVPASGPVLEEMASNLVDKASSQGSPEVLSRMMKLTQEQRLQNQVLLARLEERDTEVNYTNKVLQALLSPRPDDCLAMLASATAASVMNIKDADGATALHHAVRVGAWQVVDRLLALNSNLANCMTHMHGRPANWSPLMVLIDRSPSSLPENCHGYLLGRLIHHSTAQTIAARATSGMTAVHMAASRGQIQTIKRLLYGLYAKGGENEEALAEVRAVLNSPGGQRGSGCLDLALRCNVDLANYLEYIWGAKPQVSGHFGRR